MKLHTRCLSLVLLLAVQTTAFSAPVTFQVTLENFGPNGGVALTPLWVGFHSGNFDIYDVGSPAASFLERLAEDGNTAPITTAFGNANGRVQGTLPMPVFPGQSAVSSFTLESSGGVNNFFSYAAMVIPSNDFFVANADPLAIDVSTLLNNPGGTPISFIIGSPGTVNDAGTELESFATSAANGLFGIPGGQTGPNEGPNDPNNLIRTISGDPFASFANAPAAFNFNNSALYANGGIGRITIAAVPEPANAILLSLGLAAFGWRRRS